MIKSSPQRDSFVSNGPLDIDHIVEWSKVKEHRFENLIALCPTCHRLKQNSNDPRHINHISLGKIKSNLMMLNGRYSDIERRFIDLSRDFIKEHPDKRPAIMLHNTMYLMVKHIIDDDIVECEEVIGGFGSNHNGNIITNNQLKLTLSSYGKTFVEGLNEIT